MLMIIMLLIIGVNWRAKPNSSEQLFIDLYLHQQGKVIDIELEEYIKGTVAAEMPASFELEALKAQAVCARTYAVKKLISTVSYPQGADLSDDINTCQAFVPLQQFALTNPDRTDLLKRIDEAVESTRGEIMLYDSQPIDAVYCSTCGGRTESATAVWGGKVNYLQSVACNACQDSVHYEEVFQVDNAALNRLIGVQGDKLETKTLSLTPGGRPKKISINGHPIDTVVIRKQLNLPSTWIELTPGAQATEIKSRGYGHGVGLCQYGANGMAQQGKNYRQILQKYYSGITFYQLAY